MQFAPDGNRTVGMTFRIQLSGRRLSRPLLQRSVRTFRGRRYPYHVRSLGCRWQLAPIWVESFMALMSVDDVKIGIIGLGYVGLPLAVHMARHFPVLGFDVDIERISELQAGRDRTREVTEAEFAAAKNISFSEDPEALKQINFFIVTVPTPINQALQ